MESKRLLKLPIKLAVTARDIGRVSVATGANRPDHPAVLKKAS